MRHVARNPTKAPLNHGHIFDTGEDPRLPPPLRKFALPPCGFSMPGNRQQRQGQASPVQYVTPGSVDKRRYCVPREFHAEWELYTTDMVCLLDHRHGTDFESSQVALPRPNNPR
jgi:hypothetical protein